MDEDTWTKTLSYTKMLLSHRRLGFREVFTISITFTGVTEAKHNQTKTLLNKVLHKYTKTLLKVESSQRKLYNLVWTQLLVARQINLFKLCWFENESLTSKLSKFNGPHQSCSTKKRLRGKVRSRNWLNKNILGKI